MSEVGRLALIIDLPPIAISMVLYPTKLNTNVLLAFALIENFPFESVVVPILVPFKETDAPGKADLSSAEVTVPDTTSWALTCQLTRKRQSKKRPKIVLFFLILCKGLKIIKNYLPKHKCNFYNKK